MLSRKSFARITPALDIVRKITDGDRQGYHELAVIKHQIDLYDTISIENSHRMEVLCDRDDVPVDSSNLCWKAVELVKKFHGVDDNVRITIEKKIPAQGGLAGGSSNAAVTLELVNELWALGLNREQLSSLGIKLGMDVPYFFYGNTAFDTEANGKILPVKSDLKFNFICVLPETGVSTKDAYRAIDYSEINTRNNLTMAMQEAFSNNDYEGVIRCVHNDFEMSVFRNYPELLTIKNELLDAGCVQTFMSGSGSTITGITRDTNMAETIREKIDYQSIIATTL